jgi:hypothetical protein
MPLLRIRDVYFEFFRYPILHTVKTGIKNKITFFLLFIVSGAILHSKKNIYIKTMILDILFKNITKNIRYRIWKKSPRIRIPDPGGGGGGGG